MRVDPEPKAMWVSIIGVRRARLLYNIQPRAARSIAQRTATSTSSAMEVG